MKRRLRVPLLAVLLAVAAAQGAPLPGTAGAVRRGYLAVDGSQVHYRYSAPPPGARTRPPVFLFHLSPNSGQVFSALLPLLARDRLALAPDTPGYGMSDPLADPQRIGAYARHLARALAPVADSAAIDAVGYHTGAGIALEIDRQDALPLRRVALVAVPVLTAEERAAGAALPPIPFDEAGDWARAEWQRSWRWRGPGQGVDSVLATFAAKVRPGVRERGARAILAHDTGAALQAATAELYIVRVHDDLWEATARARALRPEARYTELADFGHGVFHAAPRRMDRLLRAFFDAPARTDD